MPITAMPTAPSRADTTNFPARGDAWISQFTNTTVGEMNALEANVTTKEASALASAASASSALATLLGIVAANAAAAWVGGTTYQQYVCVISPANRQTYRRNTTGAGTADPSADAANWTQLTYTGQILNQVSTLTATGIYGNDYALNNVAASAVVLPAAPSAGAAPIGAVPCNGLTTNYFDRNGSLIHGKAEHFYFDNAERTYYARFINATVGWRIS